MASKKFTQFGTFTVIILSLFLLFSIVMGLTVGSTDNMMMLIFIVLSLIFLILLFFFYKMVIEIDGIHISFKLGIGIFGKSYQISEIESCKPVKDSFLNGWGIHKIHNGWLYNVSGFNAVELTFKNTGKRIWIGTNKPDEITEIITGLINKSQDPDSKCTSMNHSNSKNTYVFLLAVLIIIALFNLYQYQPVRITLKENQFEISGEYGFPINYSDIVVFDTISQMPGIEMRTNGFALGKVCKGHFRLTNIGNAILFVNFNVSPFVQIVLKNGQLIYFNLNNRQSTIDMFDKIKSMKKLTQPSK